MNELTQLLYENAVSNRYPFHMPGHKRHWLSGEEDIISHIREIDITEIPEFDNLHAAKGVLKRLSEEAAGLWKSAESHILINGSSVGILAAVATAVNQGEKLIAARNCHKSVHNAIILNRLTPIYIYPALISEAGYCAGVLPEQVEAALCENPDAKAVLITSPTYEGIISDIEGIAEVCHKRNVILIVDEAHGAHLGMWAPFTEEYGMKSAISCGADIVIQSIHKTLPAFTQTSLLHINGSLVNKEKLDFYLQAYQSSSPSYVFMAGVDRCVSLLKTRGHGLFEKYAERLLNFYNSVSECKNIKVMNYDELKDRKDVFGFDIGKLVISSKKISGKALYDLLYREYELVLEMSAAGYCLAMTSILDTPDGFDRLARALHEIDDRLSDSDEIVRLYEDYDFNMQVFCQTWETFDKDKAWIPLQEAEGRVCADFIYAYPPGIPIIVQGEIFNTKIIKWINEMNRDEVDITNLEQGRVHVLV